MSWSTFAVNALMLGPGMLIGAVLGSWSRRRGFQTSRLLLGMTAVAVILGVAAAAGWAAFGSLTGGLTGIAAIYVAWAMPFAWLAMQPKKLAAPPDGSIGPASRAFERRRPPDPSA